MNGNDANSLFTLTSLLSLQGSAIATMLIPNVLGYLIGASFNPLRKWVAFAIAMLLSLLVAYVATSSDATKWIVAVFNGFLVFASAVGINQTGSGGQGVLLGANNRFFRSWF
jgi:hypothetical protein